jgi:hypothetical protein
LILDFHLFLKKMRLHFVEQIRKLCRKINRAPN